MTPTGRRLVGIGLAVGLIALGAAHAFAGSEPDPDTDDKNLGKSGGLRYSSDSEAFNLSNVGFASSIAGCGPDDWHVLGGGVRLSGPSAKQRKFGSSTSYDWYDADALPEDGWRSSGYGGAAGTLRTFAICKSEPLPGYYGGEVPDSPGPVRSFEQQCPGGKVIGGGGFIATSESFLSKSYPYDGDDANSTPDDGWAVRAYDTVGGIGGMRLHVVCQGGPVSYASAKDKAGAGKSATVVVDCPDGSHVSGGGGKIGGPGADVHLAGSHPVDDGDSGSTPDDGWKASAFNDSSNKQTLTGYAICLG